MRDNRGEFWGLAICLILATMAGPCTARAEEPTVEAKRELAEVARKAIADDIYHNCANYVPEYAATGDWHAFCRKSGWQEAQMLDDETAIAEFKRMLALWAEAAGN